MNYLPYGTCTQGTGRIGPGIERTICPREHEGNMRGTWKVCPRICLLNGKRCQPPNE